MSDSHHRLNRLRAVNTVTGGLPSNHFEAHDALQAIAHEFSVYEVETAELYAFGDRVRRILAEEEPSRGRLERIASDLDELDARIDDQIRELRSGSPPSEPFDVEPLAVVAGDWPIG